MEKVDNNTVKTKREMALERLSARYPDKEFADDEAVFGQIYDDYDDYDKQLNEYRGREEALSDMFAADPRSAAFFMQWKNGEDPAVNLVRMFGEEIKDAIDDPERQEAIAAANKEYLDRVTEEKGYEKQYTENLEATKAYLNELQEKEGLTDEDVDKITDFIITIVKDAVLGKFTPETIEMARKAMKYDSDVAQAAHEGEVKGRNEKIEEKLRKRSATDGTAALDGKSATVRRTNAKPMGVLDRYDNNKSIWERGGEKRSKY